MVALRDGVLAAGKGVATLEEADERDMKLATRVAVGRWSYRSFSTIALCAQTATACAQAATHQDAAACAPQPLVSLFTSPLYIDRFAATFRGEAAPRTTHVPVAQPAGHLGLH